MCGASAHDTAHDAAHDTSVISKQNLLLEFCADPKSRDEMQAYIDVSSRSHFSKYYLKPLLSSGKLEMMFPDKPKSKNQNILPFIPNNQEAGHWVSSPIVLLLFHSKLYSHHLPIHPILYRKFQTLHLSQQPDRSQRQPHRANQKCHNQQNCTILRGIGNKHSHAK